MNDKGNDVIINNPDFDGKLYTKKELYKKLKEERAKQRKLSLKRIILASALSLGIGIGGTLLYGAIHAEKVDNANRKVDDYFSDIEEILPDKQRELSQSVSYMQQIRDARAGMIFRLKLLTCEYCGYDYDKADQILYTSHYDKENGKYVGVRSNPDGTYTSYDEMDPIERRIEEFATGISNMNSVEEIREVYIEFNKITKMVSDAIFTQTDHVNGRSMN